jgi:hypothetical protein
MVEYMVLDADTESKLQGIRKRIDALQNWGYGESMKSLRLEAGASNGAGFVSLKALAGEYQADKKLAQCLWSCRKREEQIVACFLLPLTTSVAELEELMSSCINHEVAEYMGSLHLAQREDIAELADRWSCSDALFLQVAALTGAARHRILYASDSRISPQTFTMLTNRDYQDRYLKIIANRYNLQ